MVRARTKAKEQATEETLPEDATSFNHGALEKGPEPIGSTVDQVLANAQQAANDHTTHTNGHHTNGKSHAEAVGKKEYPKAPDPFGTEGIKAGDNRVHLLKSTADRAWVIRFDKNPNTGNDPNGKPYGKDNPHPVIPYLKSESYRWGFDQNDGKGGWGKEWQEGHYIYAEHMDARRVTQKAAEMLGAVREQGRIPD